MHLWYRRFNQYPTITPQNFSYSKAQLAPCLHHQLTELSLWAQSSEDKSYHFQVQVCQWCQHTLATMKENGKLQGLIIAWWHWDPINTKIGTLRGTGPMHYKPFVFLSFWNKNLHVNKASCQGQACLTAPPAAWFFPSWPCEGWNVAPNEKNKL